MTSVRALALLIGSAVLLGCRHGETRTWNYAPEERESANPSVDRTLVVLPFEDHRKNENDDGIQLGLIPFLPYGWADFETPEVPPTHATSGLWEFRPSEDLSRAVAEEIENARVFRETAAGSRPSDGDYVLMGEIAQTSYQGKLYSYGLSVYGRILWRMGLPSAQISNRLELHLRLAKTPSDPPIWTYTIDASDESYLYVMKDDFMYGALLKRGMKEAMPALRTAVANLQ